MVFVGMKKGYACEELAGISPSTLLFLWRHSDQENLTHNYVVFFAFKW